MKNNKKKDEDKLVFDNNHKKIQKPNKKAQQQLFYKIQQQLAQQVQAQVYKYTTVNRRAAADSGVTTDPRPAPDARC